MPHLPPSPPYTSARIVRDVVRSTREEWESFVLVSLVYKLYTTIFRDIPPPPRHFVSDTRPARATLRERRRRDESCVFPARTKRPETTACSRYRRTTRRFGKNRNRVMTQAPTFNINFDRRLHVHVACFSYTLFTVLTFERNDKLSSSEYYYTTVSSEIL